MVDKIEYYDSKVIANSFGKSYSDLGANLAKSINSGGLDIKDYLKKLKLTLIQCTYIVSLLPKYANS